MKCVKVVISTMAGILFIVGAVYSQTVDPSYEVATWSQFRSSAVSFTFDDNDLNQLAVVVPMFNEYGFKLTLFTITGTATGWKDPNWTGLQEAAAQGHEIASHTVTHPYLNQITAENQKTELEDSYNTIKEYIPSQTWQTIATPYCVKGTDSLVAQYYLGARGCSGSVEKSTPKDFFNISSIICGTEGSVKTSAHFNARVDAAVKSKGLCVFLIHGVDEDGGWSPTQSTELRTHLDYLNANPDKFWVATFGDAIRYIKERDAASVTETSVTDTEITCEVADTLDNEIFSLPVSVRRVMPEGWGAAVVKQNDEPVEYEVVVEEGVSYIAFTVVPDSGPITLSKTASSSVEAPGSLQPSTTRLMQNYPNPFNPGTEIRYHLERAGRVDIRILNAMGQDVAVLTNGHVESGDHAVSWDGRNMSGSFVSSGIYYCQIFTEDLMDVKKMILAR